MTDTARLHPLVVLVHGAVVGRWTRDRKVA